MGYGGIRWDTVVMMVVVVMVVVMPPPTYALWPSGPSRPSGLGARGTRVALASPAAPETSRARLTSDRPKCTVEAVALVALVRFPKLEPPRSKIVPADALSSTVTATG